MIQEREKKNKSNTMRQKGMIKKEDEEECYGKYCLIHETIIIKSRSLCHVNEIIYQSGPLDLPPGG